MNLQQADQARTRSDEDLEKYIKISADNIAELRKSDVYRVISSVRSDNIDGVTRVELATFIASRRADLVAEVTEVMQEDFPADGWAMGRNGNEDGGEGEEGSMSLDYVIADNAETPFVGIVRDDDDRATLVSWDLPTGEAERDDLELLVIGAVQAANDSGASTMAGLLAACATHCNSRRVDDAMTPVQQRVHDGVVAAAARIGAVQPGEPAAA